MEFDWQNSQFDLKGISQKDIEEAFEDPFSIRLLPDDSLSATSRYYLLGRSIGGIGLFCVFRTDGKTYRVIVARPMTAEEASFYDRKNAEVLL